MATKQSTTWNRDDRDLLVELRTTMQGVQNDISEARKEIKEVSSGISARLLNLEGNAVSKIELKDAYERIGALEDVKNQWIGKSQIISGGIGLLVSLLAVWAQTGKI